ncbi:MAG: zinc-ribbon domain-containing protein [Clostridia bacterium]|nr:zinc-ribbon domain-containing protein [Clostridia bacterium]
MNCSKCGNTIQDDATFCTSCGETVQAANPAHSIPTPHIPQAPVSITNENQLPDKFKPMGAWSYFGHSLLFSIPVVGTILLIIFALGGTRNINKRNFARSYFCGYLLIAIIAIILIILAAAGAISFASLTEAGIY